MLSPGNPAASAAAARKMEKTPAVSADSIWSSAARTTSPPGRALICEGFMLNPCQSSITHQVSRLS